jgi:hypothetical protein
VNKQQHIKHLFQTCSHINGVLWKQHKLQNHLEKKHHLQTYHYKMECCGKIQQIIGNEYEDYWNYNAFKIWKANLKVENCTFGKYCVHGLVPWFCSYIFTKVQFEIATFPGFLILAECHHASCISFAHLVWMHLVEVLKCKSTHQQWYTCL